jgi:glycosyltransferase involved in cell wall biosynthesis
VVASAAGALLDRGDALDAWALLDRCAALGEMSLPALRRLATELERRGYFTKALQVTRVLAEVSGGPLDGPDRADLEGKIAVLSGGFVPVVAPQPPSGANPGRVLHLVARALPATQVGYTLRTHYTVRAQRDAGLDPHVVTQMGVALGDDGVITSEIDGIPYHRIPGPTRGAEPFDVWLAAHVDKVAALVRILRPAVLHAASDFVNAQTAETIGRAYGIPVVYESRGFWEETWLSGRVQAHGWNLDRLATRHGLPDAYVWRRAIEDRLRRQADRVVTLAEVMADRIEAGGVPRDRITVIPNAVDVDQFPVLTRNRQFALQFGISDDTTVIGYISSVVEYEGIDTLVSAYATLRASVPTPLTLLIVGDGNARDSVMRQAASLGLDDVRFTGMVAHDTVLDYYSLIDIFVVPRKPVEVCHLVTPLKPFEAFATGRTVVLSDVRALAAIARQSGAAELFRAGDEASLAAVLLSLLNDPARRRRLAEAGARWVRAERTWAANAQAYLRLYDEMGVVRRRRAGHGVHDARAGRNRIDGLPAPQHSRHEPAGQF